MQERALHLFGCAEESLAGAGQLRAGRAPVEQFRAERGLQRRDAAADGRMIELQPLGGGDELPGARDREEDPDVVPVHAARFSTFSHSRCAISEIAVRKSLRHKTARQRNHQGSGT